jgi:hypothetical protein
MSSIKPKINDKKCKIEKKVSSIPTKIETNEKLIVDKNKNKKVLENSKSEIDDIFASAKSKKVSKELQSQELTYSTVPSSSSLSSSTIKQKVEEFVFKIPTIPDKSQATKRKLKLNDDNGFSDTRGTKNRILFIIVCIIRFIIFNSNLFSSRKNYRRWIADI